MKPVRFDWERPTSLEDASRLLAQEGVTAKIHAGGQSLGPMLNLRLVQPDLLVDVTAIPELTQVTEEADAVTLGACITHANLEDRRVPDPTRGALPATAGGIAYRAVRNRGTIGGSLSHADPAADWVSIFAGLGAEAVIYSPGGKRRNMPVEDYMTGPFEVALEPGELLEALRFPRLSPGARWGYYKFCRKTGEFAQAIGAVLCDPGRGVFRVVIGATESRPIVVPEATALFGGNSPEGLARRFDRERIEGLLDGRGMHDTYERQIHAVALRRALERADAA